MPRSLIGIQMQWTPLLSQVAGRYRKLAENLDDQRPLWERVVRVAVRATVLRHFREGGVEGKMYKPLKEQSVKAKMRHSSGRMVLVRSGRWMRNASSRTVWAITKKDCRLVVSRLSPHGRIHESGAKSRNLPRRPVLVWDRTFFRGFTKVAQEWFAEQVANSGL